MSDGSGPERRGIPGWRRPAGTTGSAHRLNSLDGLRALAVLMVFAHHVDQNDIPGGPLGVEVFFVLSGYLISWLLLREHDSTGGISLRRFYARRLLRLYPALVVMLVVATVAASIDHIGNPVPDDAAALVYLTDFYSLIRDHLSLVLHTWSLAVEEQFYLLWPAILLYALARAWPIAKLVAAFMAASVVVSGLIVAGHISHLRTVEAIQYLPTSHMVELGSGILLALAVRANLRILPRLAASAPALGGIALLGLGEFAMPLHWWVFPLATIACWPVVAHLVVHRSSAISKVFSIRPAVWLGQRSYAFYLWHYPILLLLSRAMTPVEEALVGLPLTIAISAVSWRVVETPFLRIKERQAVGAAGPSVLGPGIVVATK